LQRAATQLTDEKQNRDAQLQQLEVELKEKEELLENKRIDLQQLQEHQEKTKSKFFIHKENWKL
jgi:chromosome segregation protein